MAQKGQTITLHGRVFITGDIRAITGLHIGGAAGALAVGGIDSPVLRDPRDNRPYIPGSSLRGKMRSLMEKRTGRVQNFRIGEGVYVHVCYTAKEKDESGKERVLPPEQQPYTTCPVCPVFGVPGDQYTDAPTRLMVRDVFMDPRSAEELEQLDTELPYTEVKWEAAIDRVTSAAVPRQIERVPAGTVFKDMEIAFSLYYPEDVERLLTVVEAMQLLEEDYLGGMGSRGSGKIAFQNLQVRARRVRDLVEEYWPQPVATVADILQHKENLARWVREFIFPKGGTP